MSRRRPAPSPAEAAYDAYRAGRISRAEWSAVAFGTGSRAPVSGAAPARASSPAAMPTRGPSRPTWAEVTRAELAGRARETAAALEWGQLAGVAELLRELADVVELEGRP